MILETPRLILRNYKRSDLEEVHRYSSDLLTVKYMLWGPNTLTDSLDFIKRSIQESKRKPRVAYDLAIIEKSNNLLIGGVSLIRHDHQAEIGWILNRSYWGKGIATEAAHALIRFGFMDLNLDRIIATCDVDNTASYQLMRRCGFTLLSVQKEVRKSKNSSEKNHDQILAELKKEDFDHLQLITHQHR